MKKYVLLYLLSILMFITFCIASPYLFVLSGTTYKRVDVGGLRSGLNKRICEVALDDTLTLHGIDNYVVEVPLDEVATATCTSTDYRTSIKSWIDWFKRNSIEPTVEISIDSDKLEEFLSKQWVDCTNSYIEYTGSSFVLHKESNGFYPMSKEDFIDYVVNNFSTDMDVSDFCKAPTITQEDLKDVYANVCWLNDFGIEYPNGIIYNLLYIDDGVPAIGDCTLWARLFDIENFVENIDTDSFIDYLEDECNTKETKMSFSITSGNSIDVPYKTFGKAINRKAEDKFIRDALLSMEYVEHEPAIVGYDEFDDTYIEVSIEKQHLWFYIDGKLEMESDIVTGTSGKHDTPTGVYYIRERIPGKNLRGEGYVTWVNRWMRLTNSGVGLHDAYWRGSFGKDIYKRSGSHGCINLPKKFAYELYDKTYIGLPVVIY